MTPWARCVPLLGQTQPSIGGPPHCGGKEAATAPRQSCGPFPASNTVAAPTRSRDPTGSLIPVPRACGLRLGCGAPRQDRGQADKTHATVDTCPGLRAGTNRNSIPTRYPATLEEELRIGYSLDRRRGSPLRASRHVAGRARPYGRSLWGRSHSGCSAPLKTDGPRVQGRRADRRELQVFGRVAWCYTIGLGLHLYVGAVRGCVPGLVVGGHRTSECRAGCAPSSRLARK